MGSGDSATEYHVRQMVLGDLDQVMRIETLVFPHPWSSDLFQHELMANQVARYLVICRGPDVVGYVGIWLIVGEIHVTTIAVHPEDRRQGIGESLLISVIELALDHGAQLITLEVRESNLAARAMYRKYGFEEVGVRSGYYTETGEDALLMSADHIDSDGFLDNFRRLKVACSERMGQCRS